jgi:hypothetical protein
MGEGAEKLINVTESNISFPRLCYEPGSEMSDPTDAVLTVDLACQDTCAALSWKYNRTDYFLGHLKVSEPPCHNILDSNAFLAFNKNSQCVVCKRNVVHPCFVISSCYAAVFLLLLNCYYFNAFIFHWALFIMYCSFFSD